MEQPSESSRSILLRISKSWPDTSDIAEVLNGSELEETTIWKDKAFVIVIAILRYNNPANENHHNQPMRTTTTQPMRTTKTQPMRSCHTPKLSLSSNGLSFQTVPPSFQLFSIKILRIANAP
uniref:uncharacterized protein LOC118520372 isoform X5 n=1 Tax=Halichoerus grypus TaxID=9711 RepID=UPI001659B7B8|nr:uncharacterized protein LOC118520372 isoform X5 [Halichoerus grypus]